MWEGKRYLKKIFVGYVGSLLLTNLGGAMLKRVIELLVLAVCFGTSLYGRAAHPSKNVTPTEKILLSPGEHILCGSSRDGKIEFEDGSIFKALPGDASRVFENWQYKDQITFSHNPYPYYIKSSEFYIENITRGEIVHANFFHEPDPEGECTQRIRYIDPTEGVVILIQGNKGETIEWTVYENDCQFLTSWEEKDRVLIGKNSSMLENFGTNCPFILLNCDKSHLTHVRIRSID